MLLLIGLGNPGTKYQNTRHNAGHLMIDFLGEVKGFTLRKTTSHVNISGAEVKRLLDEQSIKPHNLVVVHDDLDLEPGQFKLQRNVGSAGHKGVKSIFRTLGTQKFWRLRIGIGGLSKGVEGEEYVLSEFSSAEIEVLKNLTEPIRDALRTKF